MRSFTVSMWSTLFGALRCISVFAAIRRLIPATRQSYLFVDAWVLANLLLSIGLLAACAALGVAWWEVVPIAYAILRMFEILVNQVDFLLFGPYRARKSEARLAVLQYTRLVIHVLQNYAELVFWVALLYRNWDWTFDARGMPLNSFLVSLNFSFVTMTTFGYSGVSPNTTQQTGTILVLAESAVGVFMALVVIGSLISGLALPESRDELEG
jgi:hypothetical protein